MVDTAEPKGLISSQPIDGPIRGDSILVSIDLGVYLNLVEGSVWVRDAGGSNPLTPTMEDE
jgi:hypothetical protein